MENNKEEPQPEKKLEPLSMTRDEFWDWGYALGEKWRRAIIGFFKGLWLKVRGNE